MISVKAHIILVKNDFGASFKVAPYFFRVVFAHCDNSDSGNDGRRGNSSAAA